ncbi:hypothetical protein N8Z09_02645 [Methylophilaceae bacterium]|nr:hypothetical protein [Methylophilaceae bacterium]
MKTGKEQIDRLPNLPIWRGKECAWFFIIGTVFGFLIACLAAHH